MNVAPIKLGLALRVTGMVRESSSITSFHLECVDPADWRSFHPGQFLVLRLAGVLRNYSLSGPQVPGRYRITVKREPAAAGFAPGIGSGFLHDQTAIGDVLHAEGPRGAFVLDRASRRPVVLISGGVGLTPMVAMLHDLAPTERQVLFLHACENGTVHALRDEVLSLQRPGLTAHFCYRSPTEADRASGQMHSDGMVTKALLQQLLSLDDYDFYLCGPPPFMQAVYPILRNMGVAEGRIAYEFFGPATVLTTTAIVTKPTPAPNDVITVTFQASAKSALWPGTAESLLAFAEDQGLRPDFSRRAGICSSCATRLISGEVSYFDEPLDDPGAGKVLLCCTRPVSSVVLDL